MVTGVGCMEPEVVSEDEILTNFPPPKTYRLDDVSIDLIRHAGVIVGSTDKHIRISGAGNSTQKHGGKSLSFLYSTQDLLAVINSLNQLRFFELPTIHNIKYSVYLKDDGTVGKSALRMHDAANTTVCFNIPEYKKCVTYNSDIAPELEKLVKHIFSEVDKLLKSSETEHN